MWRASPTVRGRSHTNLCLAAHWLTASYLRQTRIVTLAPNDPASASILATSRDVRATPAHAPIADISQGRTE
jgi:hypothetical protein